jgi:hypothetical protein
MKHLFARPSRKLIEAAGARTLQDFVRTGGRCQIQSRICLRLVAAKLE